MWDRGTLTFKGLANAFPAAGFQPGGSRFQRALGLGNLPSMQSCVDAWDEKRLEVNHPAVGPLSQTILNAGHGMGSRFLQRQLTRQRTDVERASLHHDIMQLPSTVSGKSFQPKARPMVSMVT